MDKDFRRKINEDKVYACGKHFKDEVIEICKYFLMNRACSSVTINIAFEAHFVVLYVVDQTSTALYFLLTLVRANDEWLTLETSAF